MNTIRVSFSLDQFGQFVWPDLGTKLFEKVIDRQQLQAKIKPQWRINYTQKYNSN